MGSRPDPGLGDTGEVAQRHRRIFSGGRVTIVTVLLIGLVPVLTLWAFQRRLVFAADRSDPGPAAAVLPGATDVLLQTSDGLELRAWLLPASAGCAVTVLVAPGNGGNRGGRVELAAAIHSVGAGVLLLDYRGYGGNPGSPSAEGLALDAEAAWAFLQRTVPEHRLVYFGESLGGAVVTRLATSHPPHALVLRSPFTDLAAAAGPHFPWLPVRWLLWDELPVRDLVATLDLPVTVIYGDADTIIEPQQSRDVAAANPRSVLVTVPAADHNDPELAAGPAVIDAVRDAVGCPPG